MSGLPLTLACHRNDRSEPLFDGRVRPEGIDLNPIALEPEELFHRFSRYQDFPVSEMSMSSYLIARDRGIDVVAIPVFPSRFFRHGGMFVHTDAGIDDPTALRGKRVGIPEYEMTALLWQKGILADEYGVGPDEVTWVQGGLADPRREERFDLDLPPEITVERADAALNDLIVDGDISALLTARTPAVYHTSDRVVRLFPDYPAVEADYFERTGHFPIMHTVAMRGDFYRENEWVALELYKAFETAKALALSRLDDDGELTVALPWLGAELARTREVMGDDYWPYGVEANRHTLETMARYSHEQGMTSEQLPVDELFAPSTTEHVTQRPD